MVQGLWFGVLGLAALKCLQALRQANVKVWMLTGDKRETAHDIAKTTCLIDNDTVKCVCACFTADFRL